MNLAALLAGASGLAALAQSNPINVAIEVAAVQVSWSSEKNRQYQVEYSSTLTSNQWVNIGGQVAGNGSNNFILDSVTGQFQKFYRVRQLSPVFIYGTAARGRLDLNGKNITTDSFDSTDPTKSTGGVYDPIKATDHGDIAAYLGITNSVNVGNALLDGKVSTGPDASVWVGPGGSIGDKAWHAAGNLGIEPGFVTNDMNMEFPDAVCPFTGGGYVPYTTPPSSLSAGLYKISNFSVGGSYAITINGEVSIWAPYGLSMSGNGEIDIAPGGKLTIYTGGPTSISGNGIVNQGDASLCAIYGLPSCTSIFYSGNAAFTGTIYAPNADFAMNGGGTGNSATYDFVGASVTKTVTMNGNFNFHYDEALRKRGPVR